MDKCQSGDQVVLTLVKNFDIGQILECGQAFRFHKVQDHVYVVIAFEKVLYVKQDQQTVYFYPCTLQEFEKIWHNYFDLTRDYDAIKETIAKNDVIMQQAVAFGSGIRLLNQDPYECLISFIVSQNNHIPRIKKIINQLSTDHGQKLDDPYGGDFYGFPSWDKLNQLKIEELMACNTGFRAKYIKDACHKIATGEINLQALVAQDETSAREQLMSIYGVGQKVADCVLLFSLEKYATFPTDVWIKRVMEALYFQGKPTPISEIQRFSQEKWGANRGFAQQYLFHYAKENKIGAKKEDK